MLCFVITAFAESEQPLPQMFAHRGCWSKICPENSLPAVVRAAQHGYMGIECDRLGMRFIKNKGMVTLHGVEDTKIKSAKIYFYKF